MKFQSVSAGPRIGTIRLLAPDERPLLREHLLRLDGESRRLRFNGSIDNDFITRYVATCCGDGVIVIAYMLDGVVRGAAELHAASSAVGGAPEVAFSVEHPARRHGVGSILFERLLQEARRHGYSQLRVTTGAQNDAMRALARKFGTRLSFAQGELTGLIELSPPAAPGDEPDKPLPLVFRPTPVST